MKKLTSWFRRTFKFRSDMKKYRNFNRTIGAMYITITGQIRYYSSRYRDDILDAYFPQKCRTKYLSYMKIINKFGFSPGDTLILKELNDGYGSSMLTERDINKLRSLFETKRDLVSFIKLTLRLREIYAATIGSSSVLENGYIDFLKQCVYLTTAPLNEFLTKKGE